MEADHIEEIQVQINTVEIADMHARDLKVTDAVCSPVLGTLISSGNSSPLAIPVPPPLPSRISPSQSPSRWGNEDGEEYGVSTPTSITSTGNWILKA